MTHYATCTNCAMDKATCPRRANLQKALKGSAVYSVKFKCPERKAFFSPGQRVEFNWSLWETADDDSYEIPLVFRGTVIRERGTKFVVQVDSGKDVSDEGIEASDVFKKNDALIIKVRPANMRPINEAPRAVCATCYHVEGHPEDRCYKQTDWVPRGCIEPTRPDTSEAEVHYEF